MPANPPPTAAVAPTVRLVMEPLVSYRVFVVGPSTRLADMMLDDEVVIIRVECRVAQAPEDTEVRFPTVKEEVKDAECKICYETAPEAVKCLHCKKWVACVPCATKWIQSRREERAPQACPWCRADWTDLEKSVVKNA
ncbi:unnamed protein product [Bursaphelenchus okinawaensis]|uniref:RING-type domain-containing protein n=1 Tax=Bursaphelenchus okinawaensis TaxID=465554 RepID=A0A811KH73_9BILA|nr:unnamed protein product [Bursaphelenchus okinawaensis]CAG9103256.1 unnamed protein product [Bursaphelenchus okinawaensis]